MLSLCMMALSFVSRVVYILLASPFILTRFSLDLVLCLLPWTRPAREWSINQAARVRVVRLVLLYWSLWKFGDRLPLTPGSEKNRFSVCKPRSSKLYQGPLAARDVSPQPLGATWTPALPPPAGIVRKNVTVALHFHGGAFVIGDGRDGDAGFVSKTLVKHMGVSYVCSPQYRLSSHKGSHYPAQLQDAVTAYMHLILDRGIPPSQIVLSGDSAGGNLALGLLRYIHEHGKGLGIEPPAAITLWSPWLDVDAALNQDMRMAPNYKTDYLNRDFGRWGASTLTKSGLIDAKGPYLSPLHHPFKLETDIPIYVNAGAREVLCDDIQEFAKRYRAIGWNVHLQVSRGCPHDFILLGPRMGFGESAEEAAREARTFLAQSTNLSLRGVP